MDESGVKNNGMSPQGEQLRPLRVIVADDDPFARRFVKDALQAGGIVVIAEATTGRQAVELTLHYRPDAVLMDIVMPDVDGITATRKIVAERPEQRVVLLTGSEEDDDMAIVGLQAGAVGYLTKDVPVEALPRVLRAVANGGVAVSRRVTARLVADLRQTLGRLDGMRPVHSTLSNREWEVLGLIAQQRTNAEIAESLVLSQATVRSHVKSILRKLDVRSREAAVDVAERMRLGHG